MAFEPAGEAKARALKGTRPAARHEEITMLETGPVGEIASSLNVGSGSGSLYLTASTATSCAEAGVVPFCPGPS